MGRHDVRTESDRGDLRVFMQKVLDDVTALERMLEAGLFTDDVARLGAEQELVLVDRELRPAPRAMEVLEAIGDPRFTTEVALFNLELNVDPIPIGPDCLRRLAAALDAALDRARRAAAAHDADVVLTGILPTLDKGDLDDANMTPLPRYRALADAVRRLRGGPFELAVEGQDQLALAHDSVMLEACNTSFQVHLQVAPERFAEVYNVAQAVTAPLLAAAVSSPLLFGRRLWRETRIAVFEQVIDTRGTRSHRREVPARVSFGDRWVDASVLEIFRDSVARFRLLVSRPVEEDSLAVLDAGGVPRLAALSLHNGTVYRWNRPCYGVTEGKPHLRIENRVLPAGPSVLDEVANTALWLGLVRGVHDAVGDVRRRLSFAAAKESFLAAARHGLQAELAWLDERSVPARELLLEELLPVARRGLRDAGVDPEDADRYLDVVEERVRRRRTGAQWLLDSLAAMGDAGTPAERLAGLTAATVARQREGKPVADWPLAHLGESGRREHHYARVAALMTTSLFTVHEDEVLDLVASVMDWRHVRHVPVEDDEHRLVGLVTHRGVLRALARDRGRADGAARERRAPIPVRQVMQRDVVTVEPATPTLAAIELMRRHKVSALPVVENGKLVGIVTERDFMKIARQLLEDFLGREPSEPPAAV